MHEMNINGVDLNLVPALEALLRQRNVTRAAADIGLSQPAMSRALARLRILLGDPLMVRTSRGYSLTPKAEQLRPQLAVALTSLRGMFQPQPFDAGIERRVLKLAAADVHTVLLLPGVMARLTRDAPGVDLRIEAYRPDVLSRLADGSIDLAFGMTTTPLPPGVVSKTVFTDRLALVMRAGHPNAGLPWTLMDYGRHSHVGVSILGDGQSHLDAVLAAAGVTRRIALVTPNFTAALATVAQTDMVTTISAALARRFAPSFDLVLREPPFAETALLTTLVGSAVRATDPFLVWFQTVVRDVGESLAREVSHENG
jgi:DNA-binding transcriptional LysR family regulator